jgi:hypothetical protein
MPIHLRLVFDRLILPRRRIRLQSAIRDQLDVSIGRRRSRRLIFRSVQVPEMLDQATPCEGVCEVCQVVREWGLRHIELRVRTTPLGRFVIPEYDLVYSHLVAAK